MVIRPLNLFLLLLLLMLVRLALPQPWAAQDAFIFLAVVLTAAGGYWLNDWADRAIDAINRPERYFVRQPPKPSWFWGIYTLGQGLALAAAGMVSLGVLILTMVVAFLLFLYAFWLKRSLLWGNALVALCSALPIAAVLLPYPKAWTSYASLQMALAFWVSALRELIKDLEDRAGDAQHGCRSFPLVYGLRASRHLGYAYGLICGLLLAWGLFLLEGGAYWAWLVSLFPCLIGLLWQLAKMEERSNFRQLSHLAKLFLALGILHWLWI